MLTAAVAETAGTQDLTEADGVFRREAQDVQPDYALQTVNTDGWQATPQAWKTLFPLSVVLQCNLHAWLDLGDRARHVGDLFSETSPRVWDVYRPIRKRTCAARIRSLTNWAQKNLGGVVQEKMLDLCRKKTSPSSPKPVRAFCGSDPFAA